MHGALMTVIRRKIDKALEVYYRFAKNPLPRIPQNGTLPSPPKKKEEEACPQEAHPPIHNMQMKRHLPCKTMIIDFRHSFKDYDVILNFYGAWNYECPPHVQCENAPCA